MVVVDKTAGLGRKHGACAELNKKSRSFPVNMIFNQVSGEDGSAFRRQAFVLA